MDRATRENIEELRTEGAELQHGLVILLEAIDVMLTSEDASRLAEITKSVEEFGRGMTRVVRGLTARQLMDQAARVKLGKLADEIADQRAALDELHASIERVLETGNVAEATNVTEHVRAYSQVLIDAARRLATA